MIQMIEVMSPFLGGILGLFAGSLVLTRLITWGVAVWEAWQDCRIAGKYPHLRRLKHPWTFAVVLLGHSGTWVLAGIIIATISILTGSRKPFFVWFLVGVYAYPVLMAPAIVAAVRRKGGGVGRQ